MKSCIGQTPSSTERISCYDYTFSTECRCSPGNRNASPITYCSAVCSFAVSSLAHYIQNRIAGAEMSEWPRAPSTPHWRLSLGWWSSVRDTECRCGRQVLEMKTEALLSRAIFIRQTLACVLSDTKSAVGIWGQISREWQISRRRWHRSTWKYAWW